MPEEKKDDVVLLSNDTKQSKSEQDAIVNAGLIPITVDQLMELAAMARDRKDGFDAVAKRCMTRERALRIKELRGDNSWRGVAGICFSEWTADGIIAPGDHWYPPTNQLMGMSLCEIAANFLNENVDDFPWQSKT